MRPAVGIWTRLPAAGPAPLQRVPRLGRGGSLARHAARGGAVGPAGRVLPGRRRRGRRSRRPPSRLAAAAAAAATATCCCHWGLCVPCADAPVAAAATAAVAGSPLPVPRAAAHTPSAARTWSFLSAPPSLPDRPLFATTLWIREPLRVLPLYAHLVASSSPRSRCARAASRWTLSWCGQRWRRRRTQPPPTRWRRHPQTRA